MHNHNEQPDAERKVYSDEFETKFHYAVQQRSVNPLIDEQLKYKSEPKSEPIPGTDDPGADRCPLYKRHPLIFWTVVGAIITALANGYKSHKVKPPTDTVIKSNTTSQ